MRRDQRERRQGDKGGQVSLRRVERRQREVGVAARRDRCGRGICSDMGMDIAIEEKARRERGRVCCET